VRWHDDRVIVQSSPGPGAHLVLTMEQHTATARELAAHFGGTGRFDRVEPVELIVTMVGEHDRGWVEVDAEAPRDPTTDLPWSVYQTPMWISIGTGPRSIDHNERCHPYRGLLSSMHIVGLFTGRYGLDERPIIDQLDTESRALLEPMIASEHRRQDQLRLALAEDPSTAPWLGDDVLMRNYKALQFFDRLALWLQVSHPTLRRPTVLPHVPTTGIEDVPVEIVPLDERLVRLDPFPFDTEPLELALEGRWLAPQPPDTDLARALVTAPVARQPVTLCAP
jgi:hypothetical protein